MSVDAKAVTQITWISFIGTLVIVVALFVGLPLGGWGVNECIDFLRLVAPITVFLLAAVVAHLFGPTQASKQDEHTDTRRRLALAIIILLQLLTVAVIVVSSVLRWFTFLQAANIASVLIALFSGIIGFVAAYYLRRTA